MLSWGGFSARAHHAGQSPLNWLRSGKSTLSPMLSMAEDLDAGLAPGFQADGYPRARRTALIDGGRFADWLVSPRTAREYHLAGNAAGDGEMPETLRVQPGSMKASDALAALGTGLSISNFWYLNFSDRPSARVTGMTRFACLWVDKGEPVAPVEAMRFDDSLYRLLGDQLLALGDTAVLMPAGDTYDARATGGIEVPGALLGAVRFAL
jgi:predicted Zn-dependent protease